VDTACQSVGRARAPSPSLRGPVEPVIAGSPPCTRSRLARPLRTTARMPSTYLALPLLAPLLLAGPARTTAVDGHVSFEIVETTKGTKHRTRFELPANGKIETWTATGEQRRWCSVESSLDRSGGERRVRLKCKAHPQSAVVDLEVEAEPPVDLRGRMLLADIDRPDGRRIEVAMKTS